MRHRWVKIDEDMRRYIYERRPILHRCAKCGLYRMKFNFGDKRFPEWKTFYGKPYNARKQRPECQ